MCPLNVGNVLCMGIDITANDKLVPGRDSRTLSAKEHSGKLSVLFYAMDITKHRSSITLKFHRI